MSPQLSPTQLPQWLQSVHGKAVVLDVRNPAEIQQTSVQAHGFTLLAIPMASIPERWSELDPTQPVACLCQHGVRSMQVAQFLVHQGFTQVVNLAGGIEAWPAATKRSGHSLKSA